MLPVTQTSLVSQMYATAPTRRATEELVRYLRSEYRVNDVSARAMVERAGTARSVRVRRGSRGWVRRLLAAFAETIAAGRASPGGA